MKKTVWIAGATALLVVILTAGALAGGWGVRRSDGQACLELTDGQKAALAELKDQFHQRLIQIRQTMRAATTTERETARESMDTLRAEIQDEMQDILTPDQLDQLAGRPFFLEGKPGNRRGGTGPWAGHAGGEPCITLTDEQKAAVAQVREQFHVRMADLNRLARESRDAGTDFDLQTAVTALRDEFGAQMLELLTPTQREQVEQNCSEFLSGRGGHRAGIGRMGTRPGMDRGCSMSRGGKLGAVQTSL